MSLPKLASDLPTFAACCATFAWAQLVMAISPVFSISVSGLVVGEPELSAVPLLVELDAEGLGREDAVVWRRLLRLLGHFVLAFGFPLWAAKECGTSTLP